MSINEMKRRILALEEKLRRLESLVSEDSQLTATTRGVVRKPNPTQKQTNQDQTPRWA